jgi:FtsP/CotA-like multicopper oxidase with cupredoxin domain
VNRYFTNTLNVKKVDKKGGVVRVRVINTAGFSMFRFSVDGMPLKIIEIDGVAVKPFFVSTFTVNVAQRVSFLLDWSLLNNTIADTNAIWFRFNGIPEMYPTYDTTYCVCKRFVWKYKQVAMKYKLERIDTIRCQTKLF